jgi:hypothetical protein
MAMCRTILLPVILSQLKVTAVLHFWESVALQSVQDHRTSSIRNQQTVQTSIHCYPDLDPRMLSTSMIKVQVMTSEHCHVQLKLLARTRCHTRPLHWHCPWRMNVSAWWNNLSTQHQAAV